MLSCQFIVSTESISISLLMLSDVPSHELLLNRFLPPKQGSEGVLGEKSAMKELQGPLEAEDEGRDQGDDPHKFQEVRRGDEGCQQLVTRARKPARQYVPMKAAIAAKIAETIALRPLNRAVAITLKPWNVSAINISRPCKMAIADTSRPRNRAVANTLKISRMPRTNTIKASETNSQRGVSK